MIAAKPNPPEPAVPFGESPFELRLRAGSAPSEVTTREALETGELGFVHSFTTGSAVDGPGLRVVAWLAGCQFQCVYCHNPDTWKMRNGTEVTLARAVDVLRQYRHGLRTMKGGLTISGGEPLLQTRFVLKVFSAAQSLGIHTALDTNGYLGERLTDADLGCIDLVLLDLKTMSPEGHQRLTGVDNGPVLTFAGRLAALGKPVWIRFVLVPAWTDNASEISEMARFAAGLGNVQRVEVLPFHQMGRFKWKQLGLDYALEEAQAPPPSLAQEVVDRFRAAGLRAF